jgi:hypothetical protein
MEKLKKALFYLALRQEENFANKTCSFIICWEMECDRFLVVECFDLKLPKRKIGLIIWDNEKEKIYGPFMLKNENTENKIKNVLFFEKNKVGLPEDLPTENTLHNYWFFKPDNFEIELHLTFATKPLTEICVSGFDKEEPKLKEVPNLLHNTSSNDNEYHQLRVFCNLYNSKEAADKKSIEQLINAGETKSTNPKFFNAFFRYLTTDYGTDEERNPDNEQTVKDMFHACKSDLERTITFEACNPKGEIHANLKELYSLED